MVAGSRWILTEENNEGWLQRTMNQCAQSTEQQVHLVLWADTHTSSGQSNPATIGHDFKGRQFEADLQRYQRSGIAAETAPCRPPPLRRLR